MEWVKQADFWNLSHT